jgi:hypothetical protein
LYNTVHNLTEGGTAKNSIHPFLLCTPGSHPKQLHEFKLKKNCPILYPKISTKYIPHTQTTRRRRRRIVYPDNSGKYVTNPQNRQIREAIQTQADKEKRDRFQASKLLKG